MDRIFLNGVVCTPEVAKKPCFSLRYNAFSKNSAGTAKPEKQKQRSEKEIEYSCIL